MPKFKKIKNKKNIIYKLAGDQDNFTNEDKKKLFKLLKKIENGESISEKFIQPLWIKIQRLRESIEC